MATELRGMATRLVVVTARAAEAAKVAWATQADAMAEAGAARAVGGEAAVDGAAAKAAAAKAEVGWAAVKAASVKAAAAAAGAAVVETGPVREAAVGRPAGRCLPWPAASVPHSTLGRLHADLRSSTNPANYG